MSRLSKVKEFAPQMPLSTVVFEEIPELYEAPSRESDAYWDSLVPPGKGFVQIPNPEDYNLKPGILTQTSVERYSVTMYHELHCLALLRRYYWHLVDAVSNGWHEDARQEMVREQLYNHHPHHCFAYLAQGIMCNADLTMEWARVEKDGRRFQVEGWGIPHHQCKDPKAVNMLSDKEKLETYLQRNGQTLYICLQRIDFSGILRARFVPVARCVQIAQGNEEYIIPQVSMIITVSTAPQCFPTSNDLEVWVLRPDWSSLRTCGFRENNASVMCFLEHKEA
ncbi:Protein of unknown function DUF3328 [Penicillium expansum]|uniref:Uncharacterized protein n=1 Tax=Penicillium expansum TaxID=27334 RepID=A0A0A2IQ62_PENEN|nr:Protein of unknown function DUF3328 [Penicillium expansum]KGO43450.1 Protein of unknown function DUF3328 [Penicillium expansum]KGO45202.1 Protein of unknown function DUF3328 [Penicillium expansum]KGO56589.1 Protein of unknown function DUF3328 [Penicillium expansum]